MFKFMVRVVMFLPLLFGSALALAANVTYSVDSSHTRVWFTVAHLGFSTMPGIFHDLTVKFAFDEQNPANSSLDVTIQAASIDMFHDGLNTHLKNKDFFNVEQFPTITFKSTKIEATGANTARVTGDFTLLGVTKPVSLDVTMNKLGADRKPGVTRIGFGGQGIINRADFGMGYGVPMVGGDIKFDLSMEATTGGE